MKLLLLAFLVGVTLADRLDHLLPPRTSQPYNAYSYVPPAPQPNTPKPYTYPTPSPYSYIPPRVIKTPPPPPPPTTTTAKPYVYPKPTYLPPVVRTQPPPPPPTPARPYLPPVTRPPKPDNRYLPPGAQATLPVVIDAYSSQQTQHHQQQQPAAILRLDNVNNGDGNYQFRLETENGIQHEETGQLKDVGSEEAATVVRGSYSYTGADGQVYTVNYIADENGFQAYGDHLPTPPPIPAEIQESLARNAAEEASQQHNQLYN